MSTQILCCFGGLEFLGLLGWGGLGYVGLGGWALVVSFSGVFLKLRPLEQFFFLTVVDCPLWTCKLIVLLLLFFEMSLLCHLCCSHPN